MADLEKRLSSDIDLKPYIWWRYIDDIFLIWEHGEESLKLFLGKINSIHPTIKFTADWSYSSVNFLDVNVINLQTLHHATHITAKKVSLTAKLSVLIESVLIMPSLIRDVTN